MRRPGATTMDPSPLDAPMAQLGLSAMAVGFSGRAWEGAVSGRRVRMDFAPGQLGRPGRGSQPPRLEFAIDTSVDTDLRVTASPADAAPTAAHHTIDFPGLGAQAVDAEWARALLGDPGAAEAVRRMATGLGPGGFVRLQRRWLRVTLDVALLGDPPTVARSVADATTVLDVAEGLPAPRVTSAASDRAERRLLVWLVGAPLALGCAAVALFFAGIAGLVMVKYLQHVAG